jgi:hypothetical protein
LWLTAGDLNGVTDRAVKESAVTGRVVAVQRRVLGTRLVFDLPRFLWRRRWLPSTTVRQAIYRAVQLASMVNRLRARVLHLPSVSP